MKQRQQWSKTEKNFRDWVKEKFPLWFSISGIIPDLQSKNPASHGSLHMALGPLGFLRCFSAPGDPRFVHPQTVVTAHAKTWPCSCWYTGERISSLVSAGCRLTDRGSNGLSDVSQHFQSLHTPFPSGHHLHPRSGWSDCFHLSYPGPELVEDSQATQGQAVLFLSLRENLGWGAWPAGLYQG